MGYITPEPLIVIELQDIARAGAISVSFALACGVGVVQVQMAGSSAGYFSQDPRDASSSSKDHRQVPWVPLAIRWIEIRRRAQRPCCDLQGALVVCIFCKRFRNWVRAQWMLSSSRCFVSLFR